MQHLKPSPLPPAGGLCSLAMHSVKCSPVPNLPQAQRVSISGHAAPEIITPYLRSRLNTRDADEFDVISAEYESGHDML